MSCHWFDIFLVSSTDGISRGVGAVGGEGGLEQGARVLVCRALGWCRYFFTFTIFF